MSELTKAWAAAGDPFFKPESPAFDATRGVFYVSNMADGPGMPAETHGKGFITVLSADGRVLEPRWLVGLHQAKNMAVHQGRLYVADVGRLLVVNIERARIESEYPAPGSQYLDGLAVRADGVVFVGDLLADTIWRLDPATRRFELWLQGVTLDQPDGMIAEPERLIAGGFGTLGPIGADRTGPAMGHLSAIDYQTKAVVPIGDGSPIGHIDGIAPDGAGGYLVADHVNGTLLRLDRHHRLTTIAAPGHGISDIEYVPSLGLVVVAMMFDPAVVAYRYQP